MGCYRSACKLVLVKISNLLRLETGFCDAGEEYLAKQCGGVPVVVEATSSGARVLMNLHFEGRLETLWRSFNIRPAAGMSSRCGRLP